MRNRESWFKGAMILLLLGLGVLVWIGLPGPNVMAAGQGRQTALKPESEGLYPTSAYGWLTYYMHEVFERYSQAKSNFDKGDLQMAEANLIVMEMFTVLSKDNLPDKLQDGKAFDKVGYKKNIDQLNAFSAQIRTNLKNKKWADIPKGKSDPVMGACIGCHKSYNIPTDFHRDTQFKVLTYAMHEIYELYRQAGPLLQNAEWDKAKYCFIVLKPYIEAIPQNIPAVNQEGDKIDKQLFMNAYSELKRFTDETIKALETRKWEKGKPLPPPRIVVDNCYACHSKVVKIPSPW